MSGFDEEPPDYWPSDEELAEYGYIQRSPRVRTIKSTPRVGQCFWVDFPRDSHKPEFDREHPCVVVRAAQKLDHDTCIIVPLTTAEQKEGPHTYKLLKNPNPRDDRAVWAVCDHLYTVNLCRLRAFKNKSGQPIYPKLGQPDLEAIFAGIRVSLHHVYGAPDLPTAAAPPPVGHGGTAPVVVTKKKRQRAAPKAPNAPITKVGPSGKRILTLPKKPGEGET